MKLVDAAIIYYCVTGTVHALAKLPPRARSQPRQPGPGRHGAVRCPIHFGNVASCAERLAGPGLPLVPAGPPVRAMVTGATPPPSAGLPRRAAELIAAQSGTGAAAPRGCDALVACRVMPIGARR